jgi:hypothetical protein
MEFGVRYFPIRIKVILRKIQHHVKVGKAILSVVMNVVFLKFYYCGVFSC